MMSNLLYRNLSKKTFFEKYKRYFILSLPAFFFFGAVWFAFNNIQKDILEEIKISLYEKNYTQARKLITENLENKNYARLKILMYGSVLDYLENKRDPGFHFHALLRQEDSFKIYYEGSFILKMELGANSKDFFHLVCSYLEDIQFAFSQHQAQELFKQAISTDALWNVERQSCSEVFFTHHAFVIRERIHSIKGDNVNLREAPSLQAKTLASLKKNDYVFVRKKVDASIDDKPVSWYFVLTETLQQGYVFAPYISPKPVGAEK